MKTEILVKITSKGIQKDGLKEGVLQTLLNLFFVDDVEFIEEKDGNLEPDKTVDDKRMGEYTADDLEVILREYRRLKTVEERVKRLEKQLEKEEGW